MARPRNPKTEYAVLHAAWKLFNEQGYAATSYSNIAELSSIKRATVQKYYPKKELLLIKGLEALRDICANMTQSNFPYAEEQVARLFILGQVYLSALMSTKGARRLLCDVLDDRTLAEKTITRDLLWSSSFVDSFDSAIDAFEVDDNDIKMQIIASMGGLYEIMYYCIKHDLPFNPATWMKPVAEASASIFSLSKKESKELLAECTISDDWLNELGKEAYASVFG